MVAFRQACRKVFIFLRKGKGVGLSFYVMGMGGCAFVHDFGL
jgi:hypothetical protein